jgi:hypothetical protein
MDHPAHDLFSRYVSMLTAVNGSTTIRGEMLQKLTLATSANLTIVYAPFDYVEQNARLVVVGITPGRVQAENAISAAGRAINRGCTPAEAMREAKLAGSFSGPLRENLVAMLDHVGLHRAVRIGSCAELFRPAFRDVHFTSALRYPVFVDAKNYSGNPDMLRTPLLREAVDLWLAAEARSLSHAFWLPLGPKPQVALDYLADAGILAREKLLSGLPHPSGANAERISYVLERKPRSQLSVKTSPEPIDLAREKLRAQLADLVGREV